MSELAAGAPPVTVSVISGTVVPNQLPESEMDALLLGRTKVSVKSTNIHHISLPQSSTNTSKPFSGRIYIHVLFVACLLSGLCGQQHPSHSKFFCVFYLYLCLVMFLYVC